MSETRNNVLLAVGAIIALLALCALHDGEPFSLFKPVGFLKESRR